MPYQSISEAAEEIRSGLITPTELLAEALEQIDARDGEIQVFVTVMREEAFKEADLASRGHLQSGGFLMLPHGVEPGN